MSDPQTPTPTETPKPDAKGTPTPESKGGDAYAEALRSITAERNTLAEQLKARDQRIAEVERERDGFKGQVETFGREKRESAIVENIHAKLPHLTPFEIRGSLLALSAEGVVDRHSDKPEEAAAAALEAMKTKAPALLRPPAQGGGPGGVPETKPARKSTSLI